MSDQDATVYPGFLRRQMARWNDDGSCAPSSRMRGQQKHEGFSLTLTRDEISEDLSHIEQCAKEVRCALVSRCTVVRSLWLCVASYANASATISREEQASTNELITRHRLKLTSCSHVVSAIYAIDIGNIVIN